MNFLAHIYLSGDNNYVAIGNFMADSVRGRKYKSFPKEIQKGILLHRGIDTFTDAHPIFRQSTRKLHKNYGHYAGVIVDIFYDHFLAKNWNQYSDVPLEKYAANFYEMLENNYDMLTEKVKNLMPYMISSNWLLSYGTIEGIQNVLDGMNRRTKNRSMMNLATNELKEYYKEFEKEFTSFFNELIEFSNNKLKELNRDL